MEFKSSISEKSFLASSLDQLYIMLRRNTLLQKRAIGTTLTQAIFAPFIFSFLLFVLQKADNAKQLRSNPHPPLSTLDGVGQCQGVKPGDPCITIMYYPTALPGLNVNVLMETFARKNAERTGYSLKMEPQIGLDPPNRIYDIVPAPSAEFIYDYTLNYPNTTNWGIVFNQTVPKTVQYQIWMNATNTVNGTDIYGRTVISLVRGIDEAIITVLNDPSARILTEMDIKMKDWPTIAPARTFDEIIGELGPVFFFCSEMIIFINVLNSIVSEKELKLRHGMEVMGLKPFVYWTSHLLSNTILVLLNALLTCAFGYMFRFQAFENADFGVTFLTFFLFGEAMVIFAFFITTLVRKTRVAILIGIFIYIIGLLFESFVFRTQQLGYIWWSPKTIPSIGWQVLSLIPFFNFGRMFLDIATRTTGQLDQLTNTFIPGPGFSWKNLYDPIPDNLLPIYGSDGMPSLPAPVVSWYLLMMDCLLYWILTWYFDNVIPNEFGYSRPPWFFLTRDYWGLLTGNETSIEEWLKTNSSGKANIELEGNEDADVLEAKKRVFEDSAPLKILNLRKVYSSVFNKKNSKIAVRNSCFTVQQGELLALLGQNGAGKSTTIGMLSGLTPATSGDALIFGYSVKNQIGQIRRITGICPQHDILFNELTAREHIELYAGLKGVPRSEWEPLIESRLKMVKLHSVADVRAGTYSGGMKRRLSLVIATIGDPKIVFMDEPTTGMDPVNRRHVWNFIETFKTGRVIILTTHSMEEADVLGDNIAIMSKGRLRAINNSIALKTKFGSGYRISVVTDKHEAEQIKQIISEMIPGASLEDDSAGALIYQFSSPEHIPKFIQFLESNQLGLVKTWGISQSTLEEVFLKLIRESKGLAQ